jgi:hypothetical protein
MTTVPKSSWVGIEAVRRGLPILIRLRVFDTIVRGYTHLLVVEWPYSIDSTTQLPPPEFYSRMDEFERNAVDTAERTNNGLLVAVETGLGVCRLFFLRPGRSPPGCLS